jgi:acetyl-CoA acyltransferase
MREVAIIGVGMNKFGKYIDQSLSDLGRVAIWNAIHDCDIDPKAIEAAYVGNALGGIITGQEAVRGQVIMHNSGFTGIPVVNVEGACASSSIAMREAWIAIGAGVYDVAIAVGVEKLFTDDTSKTLQAMGQNSDVEVSGNLGFTFVANYAMILRKAMEYFGWTQKQFAKVAAKNKYNGSLNPYAQFQKTMTVDEILNSRVVCYPLTLYMCSSMADGASAAILCAKEVAHKFTKRKPVTIATSVLRSDYFRDPKKSAPDAYKYIGLKGGYAEPVNMAYEQAGLGPKDVEIAEVHDAMSPAEMMRYVACGFCKAEDAPRLVDDEVTTLKGQLPVNTSGGLASRGHPIGATGIAQIAELVWQIRGEAGARQVPGHDGKGPKVALAQNSGGSIDGEPAASQATILIR